MLDDRRNAKLVDFGVPSYPNPPDLIPNNPNHSPLTTHHSPLTTHHSPLTTHHSPLTTQPTPLTFHPNPNQGAAREGAHVMLHSVQGTPAFMAPEVMQGRAHAGAPSDVWSLGVTLASLLLPDHLPFWGKDLRELKQAH